MDRNIVAENTNAQEFEFEVDETSNDRRYGSRYHISCENGKKQYYDFFRTFLLYPNNLKTIKFCNKKDQKDRNDKKDIIGEVSIATVEDRNALLGNLFRHKKPLDFLSQFVVGADVLVIESALRGQARPDTSHRHIDTPFGQLFQQDWGKLVADDQLQCLQKMLPLMSPANSDTLTGLLSMSNEAISRFGPNPYPGVSKDKCFKMVCFINVASLNCINAKFGRSAGTEAIKHYAREIDRVLQEVLESLQRQKGRKLYGTTHRKGGDEQTFVIIITGVLLSDDSNSDSHSHSHSHSDSHCDSDPPEEIKEIYDTLVTEEYDNTQEQLASSLVSLQYTSKSENSNTHVGVTVPTFLRIGFCWCKMETLDGTTIYTVEGGQHQEGNKKDIHSMIKLTEIVQEKVKKDVGLDRNDAKSLQHIRGKGKCNYFKLIECSDDNMLTWKTWLKKQREDEEMMLESNMARGLADGYFWNFVKDVALDIRDANAENGTGTGTGIGLNYSETKTVRKSVKRLFIIVPDKLNWDEGDPIADFKEKAKTYLIGCKIQNSAKRKESRIKRVTELIMPDKHGNDSNDEVEEGIIIDIPTTLTAIIMRLRDNSEYEDRRIDKKQLGRELSAFISQVVKRVKEDKEGLSTFVTVVVVTKHNSTNQDFMKKIGCLNAYLNENPHKMIVHLEKTSKDQDFQFE